MEELTRYDSSDIWEVYEGYKSLDNVEGAGGDWCKASDVVKLEEENKSCIANNISLQEMIVSRSKIIRELEEELHTMRVEKVTNHIKAILELNEEDLALVKIYCKKEIEVLLKELNNDRN